MKSIIRKNQHLDFLTDPGFQGVNRLVLPFENQAQRKSYKRYHLPTREIKNYNLMIDAHKVSDQPVRNYLITYNNIPKIAKGQVDDYPTGYLLDYNYFKKYYKMIAADLIKQQALDADPKAIQQINCSNLIFLLNIK